MTSAAWPCEIAELRMNRVNQGGIKEAKDKVAIVTGGAHGMGEAEARLSAKDGAAVRFGPSGARVNSVHSRYLPPVLNNTNAGGRSSKAGVTSLRRLSEIMDVAYGFST